MANEIIRKLRTLFMKTETTDGTLVSPAAGDAILCEGLDYQGSVDMNGREYTGIPGAFAPVPGAKAAELKFVAELRPPGSSNTPEIDEVLTGCFGTVLAGDLDTTISGTGGGTGASGTPWDVTSGTNATVGEMAMLETATADAYEVAGPIKVVDTGATPDDGTVALAAVNGAYATNGKKVKGMRTWHIKLPPPANNSLTAEIYKSAVGSSSDRYDRVAGCRGTVVVNAPGAGSIPKWAFHFKGWTVARAVNGTRPTPSYDSANPKAAVNQIFRLDGTYTHGYDFVWDLGAELGTKKSQYASGGTFGQIHAKYRPKGSFKIHPAYTSVAHFTDWEAGTAHSLLYQIGNTLNGTWAFFVPRAVWTEVAEIDDEGLEALEIKWEAAEQNDASPTSATLDAAMYLGVG